jgi:hypothetical protein
MSLSTVANDKKSMGHDTSNVQLLVKSPLEFLSVELNVIIIN